MDCHDSMLRAEHKDLTDEEFDALRARIRQCQEEHLASPDEMGCLLMDCPFPWGDCSKAAADWLLANRDDESLMLKLANDPTLGRDPHMITSLVRSEHEWMPIAKGIPALRNVAFEHIRGYSLIIDRSEVIRLAIETDTQDAYRSLLRMHRVTGLEVPRELREDLKAHLVNAGVGLKPWEDLLELSQPDDGFTFAPAMIVARNHARLMGSMQLLNWKQTEYWLLGILSMVMDSAPRIGQYGFDKSAILAYEWDVHEVLAALRNCGLDPRRLKTELRNVLEQEAGTGSDELRLRFEKAEARARLRDDNDLWAYDLLELCLESQTEPLRTAIERCQNMNE